jgi:Short C-terminal domain
MSIGRMYVTAWVLFVVLFIGAFVLGGSLGSPPIFVVGEVGAVLSFVYAMYLSLRVVRSGDPRLLKRGIRGTATVLKAKRTNTVMQEGEFEWQAPFVWKYHLRVTIPGREPYETTCSICAAGIVEGQQVDIAAAPHNHKRVTIDVGQGKGKSAAEVAGAAGLDRSSLSSLRVEAGATGADTGDESDDPIQRLERLADLHDRGVISDEELAEKKRKLLGEV